MEGNISNLKRKNSNIATWILLIFSILFFISYPFHNSFLGGLISSLCCAAMIGGLADWFAVVALFRKPLNSSILAKLFRTEIIPKNRERIFQALVDMVENELLTKESIISKLEDINVSQSIKQLAEQERKQHLTFIVDSIFKEIIDNLNHEDLENVKDLGNEFLISKLKTLELSSIISQTLDWMWSNGYKEEITDVVVNKLEDLSNTYEVRMLLEDAVLQILELNRGSFLIMFVGIFVKGNLESIARSIQRKLVAYVVQMKKSESSEREKVQNVVRKLMNKLKDDEEIKGRLEKWKNEKLEGNEGILTEFEALLKQYVSKLKSEPKDSFEITEQIVSTQLEHIIGNEEKQREVDNLLKDFVQRLVEKNHYKIGLIVKGKLDEVSGEELSNMIEPIIGNDLQLIRINGSLVGGLVGVITYMLTFWIV